MSAFLHPWALAALPLIAIPIILHLRQRRDPPTVPFPAVRYLLDATRDHERKLRLRHWLLLALRVFLLAALVLAAAGPSLPLRGVESHAPTALAIVLDNSLSSGAVLGGTPRLTLLKRAALEVVARAAPSDALWLVEADGIPRRGALEEVRRWIDSTNATGSRLDLGAALGAAGEVVQEDGRPGGVVVLTDLQASAVSGAPPGVPVVVAATEGSVPNAGIGDLDLGAEPWGVGGGRVTVRVVADAGARVPVRLEVGGRPARASLVGPDLPATVNVPPLRAGWYEIHASLDPDELRADDERSAGVLVAPVAKAEWSAAGRFAAAALETLEENHRVERGSEVTFGGLGRGASIVLPPTDAAEVGALDRALAARGIPWRFGARVEAAATTDSGAWIGRHTIAKRYRLESTESGRTGVIATAGGEPWAVRSGSVVLIGSRLEPEWTDLPLRADFVPFVDALVNRLVRGDVVALTGAPGAATLLPEGVTEVRRGSARWRVEGGAGFTPPAPGVYWLIADGDTVGALGAAADPRESDLRAADRDAVARLWHARVVPLEGAAGAAFALGARAELRGLLLWGAAIAALLELLLAGWGRRQA